MTNAAATITVDIGEAMIEIMQDAAASMLFWAVAVAWFAIVWRVYTITSRRWRRRC